MAVGQLGGITFRFAGNRFDAQLVDLPRGGRRKHHLVFKLREEGMPEGIILEHVQDSGNTHPAPGSFVQRQGLIAEDPLVFIFKQIRDMIFVLLFSDAALAAVAADILPAAAETVDGQTAAVGTALAVGHTGGIFQRIDLVDGEHGRGFSLLIPLPGDQSRPEGAHDAGNVRTDGLAFRDPLKAPQHRIIVEGTALDHDMPAKFGSVGNLDDLVEGILDDRIGKAGRNVGDGGAFLLGLLYLGIHEYRTAGTQIDGMLREEGSLGKILHRVVQGFGKGLDEGTTAGGAGFVQLYTVHGLVLDLDAFHVLPADVQNAVYLRIKECGGVVMGYRFHLALIQKESSLDQGLTVSCGTGPGDPRAGGQQAVDFLDGTDRGLQRIAVVVAVKGIKKRSVLSHQSCLGRRAAGVDPQETVAFIGSQIPGRYFVGTLPFAELVQILLGRKQGLHTGNLKIHLDGILQAVPHGRKLCRDLFLCVHGRTHGGEKMGVFGHDGMLVIQLQGADEGGPQLRQEMEGAAKKRHMTADRLAAGQSGDGLVDHRLENGRGKILLGGAVVDQRLDIGLGKNPAPRSDGIQGAVILCIFIQADGIRLQKRSHLVDERACAAGADPVHSLLDIAAFKVDDLGVLAAQLDRHIRLRSHMLQSGGNRNHLLDEGNLQMVGQGQTSGTGDHRTERQLSQLFVGFGEKLGQGFLDIRIVPLVIGKQ